MKKRNYKSPEPIWCVTNRTKRSKKTTKDGITHPRTRSNRKLQKSAGLAD